jgi:hypothetical protein
MDSVGGSAGEDWPGTHSTLLLLKVFVMQLLLSLLPPTYISSREARKVVAKDGVADFVV